MKYTLYTVKLFIIALILTSANAAAADPPTPTAPPDVPANTDRTGAKADFEQSRRELEQMREQMRELSKKMAAMSAKLGDVGPREYAWRYIGNPDRGMIGVVLAKDDKVTRVTAVTPGGPADRAGIRNGDIIESEDLHGAPGAAGKSLNETLRNLKIEQEVTLHVLRDDKPLEIKVKAERREPYNMASAFGIDGDEMRTQIEQVQEQARASAEQAREQARMSTEQIDELRKQSREIARQASEEARLTSKHFASSNHFSFSMPWWGLNLISLNADLGNYFGADHGVLVLSADADASKTLKPGDVLLAIDGKKVERPEDALRLLREGDAGSEVKVEVLRQRKTQALSMKAPEFKGMFPPPLPPVAPAAPLPSIPPAAPDAPMPPTSPAVPMPPSAPSAPAEST